MINLPLLHHEGALSPVRIQGPWAQSRPLSTTPPRKSTPSGLQFRTVKAPGFCQRFSGFTCSSPAASCWPGLQKKAGLVPLGNTDH